VKEKIKSYCSFFISLFKFLPEIKKKLGADENNKNIKKSSEITTDASVFFSPSHTLPQDDAELVAVIAAAVAASEEMDTDKFIVRSIKRRTTSKWN
jgi:hypothetical protein